MSLRKNHRKRLLISGGGTGGHIFPALSIAREFRRRHPQGKVLFVGAEGRMEMKRVPAEGFEIIGLPVAGFDRKNLLKNIPVAWKLLRSLLRSRRIIRRFHPDVVVGVGGYASGPILKEAQRRGIPTLLQEQNCYAGMTNKLLAKRAERICVAYPDMERFFPADKIVMTGNPLRPEIMKEDLTREQACALLGLDPARPVVLAIGGSLGARTVNQAMHRAIPLWQKELPDVQVVWQTGSYYFHNYTENASDSVQVRSFLENMNAAYTAATVVVSRAGALSISELEYKGCCAVLIPSPNVAEDHQRKNAMALVERDAAVMIPDDDAVEQLGPTVLALLRDPERRALMQQNIRDLALPDAATIIGDHVEQLIQQYRDSQR